MSASNEGPIHYSTNNGSSTNSPSGKSSCLKAGQGKNSVSHFLNLPAELRNEIYSFYFSEAANFRCPLSIFDLATRTESAEDHHPESRSSSSNYWACLEPLETAEEESHPGKEESIRPSTQWTSTKTDYNEHLVFNVDKVVPQPVSKSTTWLQKILGDHNSSKIVVNQEGYLHANTPAFCLVSKRIFRETWSFIYEEFAAFEIHINGYDISRLPRVHQLMELFAIQVEETIFAIIVHGFDEYDRPEPEYCPATGMRTENLRQWLQKSQSQPVPLLEMHMMRIQRQSTYPVTVRPVGAAYLEALFSLWKFLRELHNRDLQTWTKLTRYLLQKFAYSTAVNNATQALQQDHDRHNATRPLRSEIELILAAKKNKWNANEGKSLEVALSELSLSVMVGIIESWGLMLEHCGKSAAATQPHPRIHKFLSTVTKIAEIFTK